MADEQTKKTPFTILIERLTTRPGVRAFCLIVMVLALCYMSIREIDLPQYFKEVLLFIGGSYITRREEKTA